MISFFKKSHKFFFVVEHTKILQKSDNSISSHFSQIINEKNDIIKSSFKNLKVGLREKIYFLLNSFHWNII